jgi:hypothetical protein
MSPWSWSVCGFLGSGSVYIGSLALDSSYRHSASKSSYRYSFITIDLNDIVLLLSLTIQVSPSIESRGNSPS